MQGDMGDFLMGKSVVQGRKYRVYVCAWFDGSNWWTTGGKHIKSLVIVSGPRNIALNNCMYIQNMK
jgi:hypothetical protein